MQAGDIVRNPLTEQLGVVIRIGEPAYGCPGSIRVMWTTQGDSLFGPGSQEWCSERHLELLNEKS
ncbi:MAG: hypothetical protein CMQ51_06925 [Gammaproteobacteria bacterium]|nr:hypothetical protein [Gammaproteobacteria bacterium]